MTTLRSVMIDFHSVDLSQEAGEEGARRRLEFCGIDLARRTASSPITGDLVVARKLEYSSASMGTCTIELKDVLPWDLPDHSHRYFAFSRVYRDIAAKKIHMVTATFVTYEKEWPEIDEVIEASVDRWRLTGSAMLPRWMISVQALGPDQ